MGFCHPETKTIQITPAFIKNGDNPRYLLVHEICHAITDCYHARRWQSRLLRVASKAKELGQLNLASEIESEVEFYQRATIKPTSHYVYSQIGDAALDAPDASFDAIIKWVADGLLYTPDELVKRYPLAGEAFSEAKKLKAKAKQARARLAQFADAI